MPVYLGIDWSESKHDAVFLNAAGVMQAELSFAHSVDGFAKLDQVRQRLGLAAGECWVGLETAHNVLIDDLWARGYEHVFVTPPGLIKANRSRFTSSGAHDDRRDSLVIAETLRTDHGRLRPWHPDSLRLRQLRAQVSWVICLTHQHTRLYNRLRSLLLRYYPGALAVFRTPQRPILLHFLRAYPTPQAAARLDDAAFKAFARAHHYNRPPAEVWACYTRLQAQQPEASADTVQVYQAEAVQLAELLLPLIAAKTQALKVLQATFQAHPDAEIFASLPGAGDFLAPALLAKFGEDRQRFPEAAAVQALAGTCPVTEASGKVRWVHHRYACDREFRYIAQTWAHTSLQQGALYARAYYDQVRPRCASDSAALRCLANRWLAVAWKLWQTRQTYDESRHMRERTERSKPRPGNAG